MPYIPNPAALEAIARWTDPERRPLFKGQLIDKDGCACAQGDILLHNGFTPNELRLTEQSDVDRKIAELLGISHTHAILLRMVNDRADGAPEVILQPPGRNARGRTGIAKILGDQAHMVLALWQHFDRMTQSDWRKAKEVKHTQPADACFRARENSHTSLYGALAEAGLADFWLIAINAAQLYEHLNRSSDLHITTLATAEVQGAAKMRKHKYPFFFLPMLGFADPEAIIGEECAP